MPSLFKKIVLVVLLLAGGGFWYWKSHQAPSITYQTAAVTKGEIIQSVTATGTLNPVLNVQVGSQISGNIQKLFADYNSPVKANQIVAQIDPAVYQASVKQAEGDLANAQAALELAQINATRSQELRAKNATPQASLDTAVAALHQAQASVTIKVAALSRAKVDLDHCTIYSPVDGIVISRSVDVGQTVAAGFSAPVLFQIANDLAKMQIDSNVAEADVGNIQLDQDVDFTVDAFPSRTFHGKVVQVRNAPITVQNVVTYDTVIAVNNDDLKLKPGMTANVSVIIAHREDALKITNAALRFRMPEKAGATPSPAANVAGQKPGGGRRGRPERKIERTVYVLADKKSEPMPAQIKVGISDSISTEVTEGLKEGDNVVTGALSTDTSSASGGTTNPFGGGPRRF